LSVADLVKKRKEIDRVNERCKPFRVLFGTEVDIGADGALDYPDAVLREFEFVVAAVHSSLKQPPEQLTRRIVAACRHPLVHCIAHPTCRLRRVRDAVAIDLPEILAAAAENNTALEINSSPDRLDLNDIFARQAKQANVKICINTDAHSVEQLDNLAWGLAMARRGWLTKDDVLNFAGDKLLKVIKK
jgi:DNA polymerase (family 10)